MKVKATNSAVEDIRSLNQRGRSFFQRAVKHLGEGNFSTVKRIPGEEPVYVQSYDNIRMYYMYGNDGEIVLIAVESKKSADKRRRDWVRERIKKTAA